MLSHWAGSSPIAAAVQSLFRAGEPGAVFIAQKPSDLLVRRNLLLATATLSTQSVALAPGGTYTLSGGGTGTVTLSGGATGVFTAPTTLTFVVNAGSSVTLTVAGSVTTAQLEKGSTASTYQPVTDWTTEYLAAVGNAITQYTDNLGATPVTDLEQTVGLHLDTRPILLGPEQFTAGSPATLATTGWARTPTSVDGTLAVAGGVMTSTRGASDTGFAVWEKAITGLTPGATYSFSAGPLTGTAADRRLTVNTVTALGGTNLVQLFSPGGTATFVAPANGNVYVALWANGWTTGQTVATTFFSLRQSISAPNTVGQPLRGPEQLNSASGFSSATGWTLGAGFTIGSNIMSIAGGTAFATATYNLPNIPAGTFAEVVLTATRTSGGGSLSVQVVGGSGLSPFAVGASGTYRGMVAMPAGGGNRVAIVEDAGGAWIGSISVMSVKPVYGNHRSQSSAPARARLSARYNKVTARNANPVDLTGVTFTNCANALGTLSVVSDTAALAAAGLSGKCTLGNVYKLDNTLGNGTIFADFAGTAGNTNSQVLSGSIRGTGTGMLTINALAPSFTALTAGYAPITITQTPAASGNDLQIRASTGSIVYFILPDMREACYSYLPTPQVVWDATTGYDDTGFPARLVYSGAQGYATGAIDFSGSAQAQSWYGMAKLADAAAGIAIELSADGATNAGTFTFYSNTGNYVGRVFGGGAVNDRAGTPYSAPSANVASATYDLSAGTAAGQVALRVNGAVPTTTAGTLTTTGLLGNYPAYFGSRAGTGVTLPLTGDEFISIVRGGATPDANTLSYVERFCARYPALTF